MNLMIGEWKNHNYFYNPFEFAKKKLEIKDKLSFPYHAFDCDGHYSKMGANIMTEYVAKEFLKNTQ